jgi:hypothetical protein
MTDLREYRALARESGAFTDIELDILDETLAAWSENPGKLVLLVELRDGKILAGFAVARREEVSDYTFGAQALCLGPSYISNEAPRSLLAKLQDEILSKVGSAILRVETSTAKAAAFGVDALEDSGYSLIGHIPDFYARGNDYFMYAKHLRAEKSAGNSSVPSTGERQ